MNIEFVDSAEALTQLRAQKILLQPNGAALLSCTLEGVPDEQRVVFAAGGSIDGALPLPIDGLSRLVEAVLHKLHCTEALAVPAASWRSIIEVVAEPLKHNEKWSAVDRTLGVELNTRDGLVIRPTEHHLLRALADALLGFGDQDAQALHVCSTCGQFAITIAPPGSVVVSTRSASLAAQVRDLAAHLHVS